jgi:hypothetical protein
LDKTDNRIKNTVVIILPQQCFFILLFRLLRLIRLLFLRAGGPVAILKKRDKPEWGSEFLVTHVITIAAS